MGKLVFLITSLFGVLFAGNSFAAGYGSSGCEGEFQNETWGQLARQEPRIDQELGNIATASGQTGPLVKLTNCRIEWPIDEKNNPIPGYRTGVLHHVWYIKDANGESIRNEGGIRLVWYTKYKEIHVGSEVYLEPTRTLKGFTICQSPAVCATLNVLGLKEGTPVSLPGPTNR